MRKHALTKTAQHQEQGFTLVEVMIAICILAIGLLAVANMQISATESNTFSSNSTVALNLAQDQMEQLFRLEWTDTNTDPALVDTTNLNNGAAIGQYSDLNLDSLVNTDQIQTNLDETGTLNGQAGGMYTRIWNIMDNWPIADTKTICVIVTWGEANSEVGVAGAKSRKNKVCLCSTRGKVR